MSDSKPRIHIINEQHVPIALVDIRTSVTPISQLRSSNLVGGRPDFASYLRLSVQAGVTYDKPVPNKVRIVAAALFNGFNRFTSIFWSPPADEINITFLVAHDWRFNTVVEEIRFEIFPANEIVSECAERQSGERGKKEFGVRSNETVKAPIEASSLQQTTILNGEKHARWTANEAIDQAVTTLGYEDGEHESLIVAAREVSPSPTRLFEAAENLALSAGLGKEAIGEILSALLSAPSPKLPVSCAKLLHEPHTYTAVSAEANTSGSISDAVELTEGGVVRVNQDERPLPVVNRSFKVQPEEPPRELQVAQPLLPKEPVLVETERTAPASALLAAFMEREAISLALRLGQINGLGKETIGEILSAMNASSPTLPVKMQPNKHTVESATVGENTYRLISAVEVTADRKFDPRNCQLQGKDLITILQDDEYIREANGIADPVPKIALAPENEEKRPLDLPSLNHDLSLVECGFAIGLGYAIEARALEPVAGMHCIEVKVKVLPSAQQDTDLCDQGEFKLALRSRDGSQTFIELCQTRGGARIEGASIMARSGARFEVFFRLPPTANGQFLGLYDAGVPPILEPCIFPDPFTDSGSSEPSRLIAIAENLDRSKVAGPKETVDESWMDRFPDPGLRKLFKHLAEHGSVTESEIVCMLGSQQAFRKFSRMFEEHKSTVPFDVRIDMASGVKRYVREG